MNNEVVDIKNKWIFYGCVVLAVLLVAGYKMWPSDDEPSSWQTMEQLNKNEDSAEHEKSQQQTSSKQQNTHQPKTLFIDVKGAVKAPGVYQMDQGDRVLNVIKKAGGLGEKADSTKVNLAAKLKDEMVIYVPKVGEETSSKQGVIAPGNSEEKVNLNTADQSELEELSGIGPSKAAAIVTYRETQGAFKSLEDLSNVKGIGEKTLASLKPLITVK
ncbi:helix-hairpin-helix domain-containing protein [Tuberibacillus sp. Marseille-P3662]|uniref:helix-hairpin-helix domain-containing protein n=1 Tax=Tuberibacillus sp. Marseille-P3662 TaxID=1965358 RepID=UPI000A1CE229|nr:helix-hairpin-helix domain-containing protein [Tuberibacillus sp. Marseille-P3662]